MTGRVDERTSLLETSELRNGRPGPLEIGSNRRGWILFGIWLAQCFGSLNTTLVATLMTSISSDFKSSNQASLLATSYLLATATFTPLYGRLCNVLGRKRANQAAILFTAVGCLGSGLSTNMASLIGWRFVAGIGGGGINVTASIITSDMYPIRQRSLVQGIANIFVGLGMGAGGPVGGLISDRLGWRYAFLLQLPFFAVSFFATGRNLTYVTPGKGRSAWDIVKRIDYVGSLSLLIMVASLLSFLSLHYNADVGWDSPLVITAATCTITFFVIFILNEVLVASEPILAPFLLKQKIPMLVGTSYFLVAFANFTVMYSFPMWFETVKLTSASEAGLHLFPNSAAMSFGSLFSGWMMQRSGKYKVLSLTFGILPALAALAIANLKPDSSAWAQWLSIVPLGLGNAVVLQTTLIALLASLDQVHLAVGTGFTQLFRGLGQVGGVSVSSSLFQALLDWQLWQRIDIPDASELIQKIRHSSSIVRTLPPELQEAARKSYAFSLRWVFYLAAACTFTAFLVRIPIPELSLDQVVDTEPPKSRSSQRDSASSANVETEVDDGPSRTGPDVQPSKRRLSVYESDDGVDPEQM